MHGVQRLVYYMLMHNLTILIPYQPFTILPLAFFLYFHKLNITKKFNNLGFVHLIVLSDFLQVQHSVRELYTKNQYFSRH
jgi:hypothetical protein